MAKTLKYVIHPGDRFGRGIVVSEFRSADSSGKAVRWARLRCDCETFYSVRVADLFKVRQPTRSCGCLRRETASETMRRPGNLDRLADYARSPEGRARTIAFNRETKTTHGLSHTHPLYRIWYDMMNRCYDWRNAQFKDYGGRGIAVYPRWHDVRLFTEGIEKLIGPRPPGLTLDRPDNDGGYGPGNVRWATRAQQNQNSRRYKDGTRNGALYRTWWRLMDQRPDEVCPPWHNWPAFRDGISALIGARPPGLRFARIDASLPYGPGNVHWVTGTMQMEQARPARRAAPYPVKHGQFGHPLYHTWKNVIRKYPGQVHEPWLRAEQFTGDIVRLLGPQPAGAVFRRIDPDGRFEPGNVCWGPRGRPPRKN